MAEIMGSSWLTCGVYIYAFRSERFSLIMRIRLHFTAWIKAHNECEILWFFLCSLTRCHQVISLEINLFNWNICCTLRLAQSWAGCALTYRISGMTVFNSASCEPQRWVVANHNSYANANVFIRQRTNRNSSRFKLKALISISSTPPLIHVSNVFVHNF